jgi:predicted ester cyclase
MFRNAFLDFRAVIHDMIAEDDQVVTRNTFYGTHEGELLGIPPTGKEVTIELIDILRVAEGKITDHWNVVDQLGLMQQLGEISK